jgi:hypothetical protein
MEPEEDDIHLQMRRFYASLDAYWENTLDESLVSNVRAEALRLIEVIGREADPKRWEGLYGIAREVLNCETGVPGGKDFWIPVTSVPKRQR